MVNKWTRDELLSVLALYRRIRFGQMHARNSAVLSLALALNRTPSAVALKLVNFASLDPEHQKRGIAGMQHSSALDREIWEQFNSNWLRLATVDAITPQHEVPSGTSGLPTVTSKRMEVTVRIGQSYFRKCVLAAYGGCCITGIRERVLLRASHIIPWRDNEQTRLQPSNGLCLNALHDAAFDSGLIAFDERLRLLISASLPDNLPSPMYRDLFLRFEGKPIQLPERYLPLPEALDHHRQKIFKP